jgi:hypothetical protein
VPPPNLLLLAVNFDPSTMETVETGSSSSSSSSSDQPTTPTRPSSSRPRVSDQASAAAAKAFKLSLQNIFPEMTRNLGISLRLLCFCFSTALPPFYRRRLRNCACLRRRRLGALFHLVFGCVKPPSSSSSSSPFRSFVYCRPAARFSTPADGCFTQTLVGWI